MKGQRSTTYYRFYDALKILKFKVSDMEVFSFEFFFFALLEDDWDENRKIEKKSRNISNLVDLIWTEKKRRFEKIKIDKLCVNVQINHEKKTLVPVSFKIHLILSFGCILSLKRLSRFNDNFSWFFEQKERIDLESIYYRKFFKNNGILCDYSIERFKR